MYVLTPIPTYSIPVGANFSHHFCVSTNCEFPPSIIMSPFSNSGTNFLTNSSTAKPAETIGTFKIFIFHNISKSNSEFIKL